MDALRFMTFLLSSGYDSVLLEEIGVHLFSLRAATESESSQSSKGANMAFCNPHP